MRLITLPARPLSQLAPLNQRFSGVTTTLPLTGRKQTPSQAKGISLSLSSTYLLVFRPPNTSSSQRVACMFRPFIRSCVSSYRSVHLRQYLSFTSIPVQSSSDLPLLVNVRNLANRLLNSLVSSASSPSVTPTTVTSPTSSTAPRAGGPDFHVGFITPPFKDNKIPVTDHLHAHAYIGNGDLMGWWRGVAYSSVAWYSIDDLIAEIRYAFLFRMSYAVFIVLPL